MGDTRKFHCPLSDMAYKKQTAYAHSISVSIKRAETTEQLQTVVYKLAKKWQAIQNQVPNKELREEINNIIWDIIAVEFDAIKLKEKLKCK